MSNNPLRGKQNADVVYATAHTHTHTHKKKNIIIQKNKYVPIVLKMLYNWDDMHIIRFSLRRNALPSKAIAVGFLLELYFSEAKLRSKRCRP